MASFNGTYEHNLDAKNRIFVPSDFKELINGRITVRLSLSEYSHIDCYLEEDFEEIIEKEISGPENENVPRTMLDSMARAFSRTLSVDNGGRICIPATLLSEVGLDAKTSKECMIVGNGPFFQIWSPENYRKYMSQLKAFYRRREAAIYAESEKFNEYKSNGFFLELKNTYGG